MKRDDILPPLELLRAWDRDPENTQCWGLAALADELERLRNAGARQADDVVCQGCGKRGVNPCPECKV